VKQFNRVMRAMLLMMVCLVLVALFFPFLGMAQDAPSVPAVDEAPNVLMVLLGLALAISEALALIPALRSNGLIHMAVLVLKKAMNKPTT